MAWTQADAHNLRRVIAGLNARQPAGRPSAQETFDCLVALFEKAQKAYQMRLLERQREDLRQLVDDLYRTEVADEARVAVASWSVHSSVPDIEGIAAAVAEVSGGAIHAREHDAPSDWVLVVSNRPLTDTVAKAAWEAIR